MILRVSLVSILKVSECPVFSENPTKFPFRSVFCDGKAGLLSSAVLKYISSQKRNRTMMLISGVDPVRNSNGVRHLSDLSAVWFKMKQTYCKHNSQVSGGAPERFNTLFTAVLAT